MASFPVCKGYSIEEKIGRGTMGEVYRAIRVSDGKLVAVKLLHGSLRDDSLHRRFMHDEFSLLKNLEHPNIAAVYDFGFVENGSPYFTMEYIDGEPFGLDSIGRSWDVFARSTAKVLMALAELHRRGLVHGDIKPSNILIKSPEEPKLLDFGFAGTVIAPRNFIAGTIGYAAPEALLGARLDPASDIYSLGVVLFEALSGHVPGEEPQGSFDPPIVIPDEFKEVLFQMIAYEPSRRPTSADSILEVLQGTQPKPGVLKRVLGFSRLVGRGEQTKVLMERLSLAKSGKQRAVLLYGPLGAGKTRMLAEMRTAAQLEGFRTLSVNCRETATKACGTAQELLSQLVSIAGTGSEDKRGLMECDDVRQSIEDLWSHLPDSTPLLIAFDDIDQVDSGSRPVLGELWNTSRPPGLLLIASAGSPEGLEMVLGDIAPEQLVHLGGLSERASVELVESVLGEVAYATKLATLICDQVGAYPGTILPAIEGLVAEGCLRLDEQEWSAQPVAGNPSVVASAIPGAAQRRIKGLSKNAKLLLSTASVWGRVLQPGVLPKLSSLDDEKVSLLVHEGVRCGIVDLLSATGGDVVIVFCSEDIRQLLYEDLTEEKRRLLHSISAEMLQKNDRLHSPDKSMLAHHLLMSGDKLAAQDEFLRLAKESAGRFKNSEALEFCRKAIEIIQSMDDDEAPLTQLSEAHCEMGKILRNTGRIQDAISAFGSAADTAERAGDETTRIRTLIEAGNTEFSSGSYREAQISFENAVELARSSSDSLLEGYALRGLGNSFLYQSDYEKALSHYQRALSLAECGNDKKLQAGVLANMAIVFSRTGRVADALDSYGRAIEIGEAVGEKEQVRRMLVSLGVLYARLEDFDSALDRYGRSLEIAMEIGYRRGEAISRYNIAEAYGRVGNLSRALGQHQTSLRLGEELKDKALIGVNLCNMGAVSFELGAFGDALSSLDSCLETLGEVGEKRTEAIAWGNKGSVYLWLGEYEKAQSCMKRCLGTAEEIGDKEQMMIGAWMLGELKSKRGELEESRNLLSRALELADLVGSESSTIGVKAMLAMVAACEGNRTECVNLITEVTSMVAAKQKLLVTDRRAQLVAASSALELNRKGLLHGSGQIISLGKEVLDWAEETDNALLQTEAEEVLGKSYFLDGSYSQAQVHLEASADMLEQLSSRESDTSISDALFGRIEGLRSLAVAAMLLRTGIAGSTELQVASLSIESKDVTSLIDDIGLELAGSPSAGEMLMALKRKKPEEQDDHSRQKPKMTIVESLIQIAHTMNSYKDPDQLLEKMMDLAIETMEVERGLIILLDEKTGELTARVARNLEQETLLDAMKISQSVIKEVISGGSPVLCSNAQSDPKYKDRDSFIRFKITSFLCVPLRLREAVLGTVYVDRRESLTPFSRDDLGFLTAFASQAAIALENARLSKSLREENILLRRQAQERFGLGKIVGKTEKMRSLYELVEKVADSTATVLIMGESGTGKELFAKAIHHASPRRDKNFITVDCGAIPENLLESELFGHKKGAFTDATEDRRGMFEAADGGTIFLDEVANIGQGLQAKLLRALQEREIRRIGETSARHVDVRVVAATNQNLEEEVERGSFREDLYYRLNVIRMTIPPLRERRDDIPLLAQHFLNRVSGDESRRISGEAMSSLLAHDWPGNVRELENALERAVALAGSKENIGLQHIWPDAEFKGATTKGLNLREHERELVEAAIDRASGNMKEASRLLGISRTTLYSKVRTLGLRKDATDTEQS